MVGIFVCNFVPLYWLTNNNEKNEKKNLKQCKAYDREREGVQEGADGALTDEV